MAKLFNKASKWGLLSASALTAASAVQAKVPLHPNIIMFLVDDMGWQDTSLPFWTQKTPLNQQYETPNMERLASQGVKFTQAYACAVSTPTRVSLMTGMSSARHRVTNWTQSINQGTDASDTFLSWPAWNVNGLQPNNSLAQSMYATSFPQILKDNGYYTIHVGKAHLGAGSTLGANPLNLGFIENVGGTAAGNPGSYYGTSNYSNGNSFWDVPNLNQYWGTNTYLTEALTLEAIKRLNNARTANKPFYLYMSQYAIHAPIQKDDRFYQKYINKGLPTGQAAYASMIEGMDKSLGDIMNYLDANNLADSTIILFMADNGGNTGSFSLSCGDPQHCHNAPLKSGKGSIYEGGIREPMIVKWPGVTKDSTICNDYVHIYDFYPTILEMAGISNYTPVQTLDGVSFTTFLKGQTNPNPTRDLFWHFPNKWGEWDYGSESYSAIRSGDYKLIYRWYTSTFELYNITNDIAETNNILMNNQEIAKPLITRLSNYLRSVNAQRPSYKSSGGLVPWPDEVAIASSTAIGLPSVSDNNNTYWYYMKNNGIQNRNLKALSFVSNGNYSGVDCWKGAKLAKFKIVPGDVADTYGIVDTLGYYLQPGIIGTCFTPTVFKGWHMTSVTNGNINSIRIYTTSNVLLQLKTDFTLNSGYATNEPANLWNFIPVKPKVELQTSSGATENWFNIRNLATDDRKGLYITASADNAPLQGTATTQAWKFTSAPTAGKYYIQNNAGLYLSKNLVNSNFVSKNTADATAEWQVLPKMTSTAMGYMLTDNFNSTGEIIFHQMGSPYNYNASSTFDDGSIWELVPESGSTGMKSVQTFPYQMRVTGGVVHIQGVDSFKIYTLSGQEENIKEPLSSGVHIVKANGYSEKVFIE